MSAQTRDDSLRHAAALLRAAASLLDPVDAHGDPLPREASALRAAAWRVADAAQTLRATLIATGLTNVMGYDTPTGRGAMILGAVTLPTPDVDPDDATLFADVSHDNGAMVPVYHLLMEHLRMLGEEGVLTTREAIHAHATLCADALAVRIRSTAVRVAADVHDDLMEEA